MPTDITYVVGDATDPQGGGLRVVAHIVNDAGAWGRGFVLAVSRRWPEAEAAYRRAVRGGSLRLGDNLYCGYAGRMLMVANMVAQHGIRAANNPRPIRYDALRKCLAELAIMGGRESASVHMPRIGCGLAGGTWAEVEPIIRETLCAAGVPVFVYDLPPA